MESLMYDGSVVELFDAIDNVSNSIDENDTIIGKIRDKFSYIIVTHINYKKQQAYRKSMLKRYRAYLDGFYTLIEDQITVINELFHESSSYDISDIIKDLTKQLDEYCMQQRRFEFELVSDYFSKKECDIYKYVQTYSLLDKYHKAIKGCEVVLKNNKNKDNAPSEKEITATSPDWKRYYYLSICMEKQRDFSQTLLFDYLSRRKSKDDFQFYINKSLLCAADFQGQLSKSVLCQRKKMKLTQVELSKISGVDRSMIAKIEKLNQPSTLETAIKLLSALNMGIAICPFGGSGEKSLLRLELQE